MTCAGKIGSGESARARREDGRAKLAGEYLRVAGRPRGWKMKRRWFKSHSMLLWRKQAGFPVKAFSYRPFVQFEFSNCNLHKL